MTTVTARPAARPTAGMTPILEVRGITKRFTRKPDVAERIAGLLGARIDTRTVHAVDGIDLAILPGEVVGLVGESGCGKSTFGRMVAGILPKTAGELFFEGEEAAIWSARRRRAAMLAVQMIFQDPMSSLNPRKKVRDIIGEAARVHGMTSRGAQGDYVADLMKKVGLDPAYMRR